ncbi:hypothetical protein BJ165DRAFT_1401124 [Panaeolus papilionaceus]|nr:hypothetical protein BJ165DRAFT_1401124 [Panaeolus papilionaceus]
MNPHQAYKAAAHLSVEAYPSTPSSSSYYQHQHQYQPSAPPPSSFQGPSSINDSSPPRPARRNTTGSTPRRAHGPSHPPSSSSVHHPKVSSQPYSHTGITSMDDAALIGIDASEELVNDIEYAAEQIRRERQSKRIKAQQEAEAALTRGYGVDHTGAVSAAGAGGAATGSNVGGERGRPSSVPRQDMPLVGNLIGEDHANYILMYNMLTGIRVGVSRCQAKIKRELTPEDFTARHKFSFDIVGNELTPSAKYDFKFKDYAPWVFRALREDAFHLDPADYLLSLTEKYILSELGSPGKSGSFFYFSRDYRFIIKTIRHSEHQFLLKILERYYNYVKENPHTLLSRFYGLHRVKLPRGRKIHFVIMNNLFPPHKDVHETFDLKGSTVGREYPEEKAAVNPRAVLKDVNWVKRGKRLELGPEKRALLTEQLRRDSEFLKSVEVMDYSLLVGIHNVERGNRDNLRKNTLKVFSPDLPSSSSRRSKKGTSLHPNQPSPEVIAVRRAMRASDPKRLGKHTVMLPDTSRSSDGYFVFYQDEGGLQATDENNEVFKRRPESVGGQGQGEVIYYLGVIDILTPWGWMKRVENLWKGCGHPDERHKISPVPPAEYGDRFFAFMKAVMRGGEGGERFLTKAEVAEMNAGGEGEKGIVEEKRAEDGEPVGNGEPQYTEKVTEEPSRQRTRTGERESVQWVDEQQQQQ